MSYGLQVWNAAGGLVMGAGSKLARLIWAQDVAANSSGSEARAAFSGAVALAVPVGGAANVVLRASHAVSISGTTLSWSPSDTTTVSRILVFAHA